MTKETIERRQFIKQAASACATIGLASYATGRAQPQLLRERRRV